MKYQEFFEIAKEKGLTSAQIILSRSKATTIVSFNKSIDKYKIADDQTVIASGIYEGRYGSCTTDHLEKSTFPWLVDQIIKAAKTNGQESKIDFFEGSPKYAKKNVFKKELALKTPAEAIADLASLEEMARAKDDRITDFMAEYVYAEDYRELYNSKGLNLKNKANYYLYAASAFANDGENKKSWDSLIWGNDLATFSKEKMVHELIDGLFRQFGAAPCKSGQYPTVLSHDVFSNFVEVMVGSADAESIQKESSFLVGKLHEKVASSKITISERPLDKNQLFTSFDAEGVARQNRDIIKKGILQTYLYNRETALKDGVETTGNAAYRGGKIATAYTNLAVKPSKKSFEEMIAPIKEGVYITTIQGLGTGMNETNGDFSCQATGYMIRDGKLAEPLTLITLGGNVLKMFETIKDIDSKREFLPQGIVCPDVYIKSMSIGGK